MIKRRVFTPVYEISRKNVESPIFAKMRTSEKTKTMYATRVVGGHFSKSSRNLTPGFLIAYATTLLASHGSTATRGPLAAMAAQPAEC